MRFLFCSVAAALAVVVTSVHAQNYVTPSPRRSSSCSLLSSKIYCFGGYTGPSNTVVRDTSLYTLDIANVFDNFATKWEQITDAKNSDLAANQPRGRPQVSATSDGKNLVLSGGAPFSSTSVVPQHVVYNVEANAWTSLAEFDDSPNGNFRKIFLATSTYVPDLSKFFFYGGVENNPKYTWYLDHSTNVNITNPIFNNDPSRSKIGYYRMTTLDINSGTANPWQIITQQNPPTIDYYLQSSIYHNSSKNIYYFGGYYNDIYRTGTANLTFSEAVVFNTATSTWGNQSFTGSVVPTVRTDHTVTLLPSGQHVLLYGGTTNDANPSRDFCFVADLVTFVWSSCNTIRLPNNGIPYRSEHSAILDETKKIVYIIFGFSSDKSVVDNYNTVLALNVSDPQAIAFVESTQQAQPAETQPAETQTKNNGAIIGGAVGGAIGGASVVALITFLVIKKKKKKSIKKGENTEDQLSVDWDDFEGYTEVSPVANGKPNQQSSQEQQPMMQLSPALTNTNTETTTVASVIPDAAVEQSNEYPTYPRGFVITKPDVSRFN